MPATAAPPAPPASSPHAGVTIIGETAPKPPPKPTGTIRVSEMGMTAEPAAEPKKGTARERMFDSLRAKAKPTNAPVEPSPEPAVKPEPAKETTPEPATESSATTPATPEDKKKANPWKLVEQYKGKLADAEKQIAEAKTSSLAETERKSLLERAEKAESKIKQYQDEIRYTNYKKSDEFKTKYQEPYEKAWSRAMSELKELTITDPASGNSRQISVQDMLDLVNLPLPKAREAAKLLFGDFADDVMTHRKEIRSLFDSQQSALQEAEKKGAEWEKEQTEKTQKEHSELSKFITENWKSANDAAIQHPEYGKYFQQIEGDAEWNTRLTKGQELVDKAFSENPSNPNLTSEERAAVIKRHAAIRNRAIAFGAVRYKLELAEKRITELETELKGFKESEPTTEGGAPATTTTGASTTKDLVYGALRKLAK